MMSNLEKLGSYKEMTAQNASACYMSCYIQCVGKYSEISVFIVSVKVAQKWVLSDYWVGFFQMLSSNNYSILLYCRGEWMCLLRTKVNLWKLLYILKNKSARKCCSHDAIEDWFLVPWRTVQCHILLLFLYLNKQKKGIGAWKHRN